MESTTLQCLRRTFGVYPWLYFTNPPFWTMVLSAGGGARAGRSNPEPGDTADDDQLTGGSTPNSSSA